MNKVQDIGQVFKALFKDLGIEKSIEQHKAVNIWPEIAGERVAGLSKAEKIERGVLYVKVESPVWRNELVFLKAEIIKKMNTALHKSVVKDIKFI